MGLPVTKNRLLGLRGRLAVCFAAAAPSWTIWKRNPLPLTWQT